jgi:hypothetical protein
MVPRSSMWESGGEEAMELSFHSAQGTMQTHRCYRQCLTKPNNTNQFAKFTEHLF